MEILSFSADKSATKRTKERIKQHGPRFIVRQTRRPSSMDGLNCFLLESVRTDWAGWIPVRELNWNE